MHPKNLHLKPYDFFALSTAHTPLKPFLSINTSGKESINFSDAKAVLELNKAILIYQYGLKDWNIPEGYLCPPIPGRADYIHHIADIISNKKLNRPIMGLDIGVGANCIYPILGTQIYDWKMVGVDIDKTAVSSALQNVNINPVLKDKIEIRQQLDRGNIFTGIIEENEYFDFTLCNPPFYASEDEAIKNNRKKQHNLGNANTPNLNFGGMANELWCNGGEALFLKRMIKQSKLCKDQVGIFTSLVSRNEHLSNLEKLLKKMAATYHTVNMAQGHKKSRILVWHF